MNPSYDDKVMIQSVLAGDTKAFAGLVRRYETRLRGLCLSLLKNEADADDAAQEVFVKAYQSLKTFSGESAFFTWLYRIGTNHCLSVLRSHSRKVTQSWDKLVEEEGDKIESLFASSEDLKKSLEAKDLIEKILSSLKPDSRLILTLREAEGLSYEEIAETMEISLDAVKARLRRSREEVEEKLRHFLAPESV